MFSLFKPKDIEHPIFGPLKWYHGRWQAHLDVPGHGKLRVLIAGAKSGLSAGAESEALLLLSAFAAWKPRIAQALLEHSEPYNCVSSPEEAWRQASLQAAVVEPMAGIMTTELCFTTTWDEEHTLGARLQQGKWLELCGSTLLP